MKFIKSMDRIVHLNAKLKQGLQRCKNTPPPLTTSAPWEARMRKSTLWKTIGDSLSKSFSIQLKEIKASKHQEYLLHKSKECTMEDSSNVNENDKKTASKKQQQKRRDSVKNYSGDSKQSRQPKRNSRKTNNNNNSYNDNIIRATRIANKLKPEAKRRVLPLATHMFDGSTNQISPRVFYCKRHWRY